jgi:hypothetical protein
MYITVHCIGNPATDGIDDAGRLLEEVNSLIEFKFAPTDGDPLEPATSYETDNANENTMATRTMRSQRYLVAKNMQDYPD